MATTPSMPLLVHRLHDALDPIVEHVWVDPARTQDGPTSGQGSAQAIDVESDPIIFDQAPIAIGESQDLIAVVALRLPHDGSDDGIQSRAVATCGQYPDSHWSFS